MELGNLIFGHSRGEFEVPREEQWEGPLFKLLDAIDENAGIYGTHFSNDVFVVRPYYWGECTCGKDEPAHSQQCVITKNGWGATCTCGGTERFDAQEQELRDFIGTHSKSCYQTHLHSALQSLGDDEPYFSPKRDEIYKRLTAKFGLPMGGCAVHCTCGYDSRVEQWESAHPHAPDCLPTLPNFKHFASGFELRWYKYALRDSYMNQDVTPERWREIMEECRRSLKS